MRRVWVSGTNASVSARSCSPRENSELVPTEESWDGDPVLPTDTDTQDGSLQAWLQSLKPKADKSGKAAVV